MLLDHPNERSLHSHPTPRGGGIGIVVPVLLGLLVLATQDTGGARAAWIAGVGLVVAAIGLVDDIRALPALTRLLIQVISATLVTIGLGHWRVLAWPGLCTLDLGWVGIPLTVILVAGLTNAYNFMDGIDGIAGTQGVVAGLGWVGIGYALQDPFVAMVGAILAMASLAFLLFNWPPASIFMGDVGSCFLGFVLAALAVEVAPRSPAAATAGILFVWPFAFDTAFTLLNRLRRHQNLLQAHRTHLYQRLVLTGLSHRSVTVLYGILAAAGVVVGNAVAREVKFASVVGAALIGALAGGIWLTVIWRERRARTPPFTDNGTFLSS